MLGTLYALFYNGKNAVLNWKIFMSKTAEKITARLYLTQDLSEGKTILLEREQSHYLGAVMRVKTGFFLQVFNGRDGEFLAEIIDPDKRKIQLRIGQQTRPQENVTPLILYFAPLRKVRLDYLVQKAAELGVSDLIPVRTDHTNSDTVKEDKIRLNLIEAAEQTERLDIPVLHGTISIETYLEQIQTQGDMAHFICAEAGKVLPIALAVADVPQQKASFFVGPEGGFSEREKQLFQETDCLVKVGLGPRILRADTAIISGLSVWQACRGDWQNNGTDQRPPLREA